MADRGGLDRQKPQGGGLKNTSLETGVSTWYGRDFEISNKNSELH